MKSLLIGINAKYIHPNLAIRLLKKNTTYDVDIKEFNIKNTSLELYNYITENFFCQALTIVFFDVIILSR